AKFSIRRWEIDIGWLYIRLLQAVGLANVIRIAPWPVKITPRKHVDLEALRAVIINRMHVSREYACSVVVPVFQEQAQRTRGALNRRSRKLLVRDPILLSDQSRAKLQAMLAASQELKVLYDFRESLRFLWTS